MSLTSKMADAIVNAFRGAAAKREHEHQLELEARYQEIGSVLINDGVIVERAAQASRHALRVKGVNATLSELVQEARAEVRRKSR